jgi:hypothetical protein
MTYGFFLTAWDEVPLESPRSSIIEVTHADALAPLAPTGLEALSVNGTDATLDWDTNTEADVVGYHVFVGEGPDGPWQEVTPGGGTSGTTFWVQGLDSETVYHFVVTAFDEVPNESPNSEAISIETLDITPPDPPVLDALPGIVTVAPLDVTGTAEPGTTVTVYINAQEAGTATVAPDGSFTAGVNLKEGPNAITALATDVSGNIGGLADGGIVILDTTPPLAPVLDELSALTNVPIHIVTGTTEADVGVTILINGEVAGTADADGTGAFSVEVTLEEGDNVITGTVMDLAGHEGPASEGVTVVLDTIAPDPPDLASTPEYTNDEDLTVVGTTEPNAHVYVLVDGTVAEEVDADDEGVFAAEITMEGDETVVTARARDLAGNEGDLTDPVTIRMDLVAPTADAGEDFKATENVEITLDGSGSADDVGIGYWDWSFMLDGTTVDLSGETATYTFPEPVVVTVTLTVTDLAGNTATDEVVVTVKVKNSAPDLKRDTLGPDKGTIDTTFTFEVVFTDPDGDEGEVLLWVDGESFLMTADPDDTDPTDGRTYTYSGKLGKGPHDYYFTGKDSEDNVATGPSAGDGNTKSTPDVSEKKTEDTPGPGAVAVLATLVVAMVAVKARRRRHTI